MNYKIYLSFSLLITILLTGCAIVESPAANEAKNKYAANIAAEPKMKFLEGKVMLPPHEDLTLEQLADTTYPDASQKEAILAWDRIRMEYEASVMKLRSLSLMIEYYNAAKNLRLALYQGNITFGEFNRKLKNAYDNVKQKIEEHNDKVRADVSKGLMTRTPDENPQPTHRSTHTDCQTLGNQVSCTTY